MVADEIPGLVAGGYFTHPGEMLSGHDAEFRQGKIWIASSPVNSTDRLRSTIHGDVRVTIGSFTLVEHRPGEGLTKCGRVGEAQPLAIAAPAALRSEIRMHEHPQLHY